MDLPYSGLSLVAGFALLVWMADYFAFLYWGGALDDEWPPHTLLVTGICVIAFVLLASAMDAANFLQQLFVDPRTAQGLLSNIWADFLQWSSLGVVCFIGMAFKTIRAERRLKNGHAGAAQRQ